MMALASATKNLTGAFRPRLWGAAGGLTMRPRGSRSGESRISSRTHSEMLLTATALPAADAARHGLVNQLTGEGEALDAAMTLAGRIRAHSPQATRITRQVVDATRGLDDYTAFTVQDPLTEPVFATASAAEGTRAFRDKRSPAWSR